MQKKEKELKKEYERLVERKKIRVGMIKNIKRLKYYIKKMRNKEVTAKRRSRQKKEINNNKQLKIIACKAGDTPE